MANRLTRTNSILLVGNWRDDDFQEPLTEMRAAAAVRCVENLESAKRELQLGAAPRLIVLAQSRRGQFQDADVAVLSRLSPISRVVHLLNGWCEGEQRTGQPLAAARRVYWHQWRWQFVRQWRGPARLADWFQQPTMTPADRGLLVAPPARNARSQRVVIASERRVDFDALAEMLHPLVDSAVWAPTLRGDGRLLSKTKDETRPILVWDCTLWSDAESERLRRATTVSDFARVAVLLGWPRQDQLAAARAAGADEVFSKPLWIDDLNAWLRAGVEQQQIVRRA